MDENTTLISSSPSIFPCIPDNLVTESGNPLEDTVEEWLEDETLLGFRVWQFAGIILSIFISIIIGLCCCIRFRIPRTKQEIEADYIRKRIAKRFRKELSKISDAEMDEMDLRKALDRIRSLFDAETCELQKDYNDTINKDVQHGLRARFNAMFSGIHIRFTSRNIENVTV